MTKFFCKSFVKKIFFIFLHIMKIVPNKTNLLLFAFLLTINAFAAPPGGGPPPPTPPPPPGLPVDDGILILLLVALLYGFYTVRKLSLQSK